MTVEELKALFEKHDDGEFRRFNRITNPYSSRADLHAFMMLDGLAPYREGDSGSDIVSCAEHDQIWLSISLDDLAAANPSEEQIIDLVRCGVRIDSDTDSLAMFV